VGVGKDLLQLSLKNIYLKKPTRLKNDFWQLAATSFAKSKENISPPPPEKWPTTQPTQQTRPFVLYSLFFPAKNTRSLYYPAASIAT